MMIIGVLEVILNLIISHDINGKKKKRNQNI